MGNIKSIKQLPGQRAGTIQNDEWRKNPKSEVRNPNRKDNFPNVVQACDF